MPRSSAPAVGPALVVVSALMVLLLAGCTTAPDGSDDNQTNDAGDRPDNGTGNGGGDDGSGGNDGTNGSGTRVLHETIDQGAYGQGSEEPETRVIDNDADWGAFWQDHAERSSGAGTAGTPPEVDFDTQFVLYAYAGQRNTGGYTIDIREVRAEDGGYTASVTELQPDDSCATTEALTYPFHLVRVDRGEQDTGATPEFAFEHETQTYGC